MSKARLKKKKHTEKEVSQSTRPTCGEKVVSLFHIQGLSTDFFLVFKTDHKTNQRTQRKCLTYYKTYTNLFTPLKM